MSNVEIPVIPSQQPIDLKELIAHVATNDQAAAALGSELIWFLQLPRKRSNKRVDTAWGDKTDAGLARSLIRFLEDKAVNLKG